MPQSGVSATTAARTARARDPRRDADRAARPERAARAGRPESARASRTGDPRTLRDDGLRPVRGDFAHPDADPALVTGSEAVRAGSRGLPARHTVRISGRGAEGYATRNGTRPSAAQRHSQIKRHERAGFRPDRVAMWAVLLGVTMMLAAAASSHAAVLALHHTLALH